MAFVQHRTQRAVRHHEGISPGLADTCNRGIARRLFSGRWQPVVDICGGPHPDSGDAHLHHLARRDNWPCHWAEGLRFRTEAANVPFRRAASRLDTDLHLPRGDIRRCALPRC